MDISGLSELLRGFLGLWVKSYYSGEIQMDASEITPHHQNSKSETISNLEVMVEISAALKDQKDAEVLVPSYLTELISSAPEEAGWILKNFCRLE